MAIYYKPQSPIQSGEDFIYPITTADQIMKSDKSRRLEQAGLIVADNSTSLGGVAANDYALKTDTAPDSAKLGGKAPEYYLQPRNLLDNSDFRNPVNQRGFVSDESVATYNYFIDRWLNGEESSIAPNMSSNGIKPNGAFYQPLDNLSTYIGRNMTFAVGLSSGDIVTTSGTLTDVSSSDIGIFNTTDGQNEISVGSYGGLWYAWIDYPSSTIQWAALYEGSYTAETLPPYVPKGYAAELAECQRYALPFNDAGSSGFSGYLHSDGVTARIFIPTPIRFRSDAVPSISVYDITALRVYPWNAKVASISVSNVTNSGVLVYAILESSKTPGNTPCVLKFNTPFGIYNDL